MARLRPVDDLDAAYLELLLEGGGNGDNVDLSLDVVGALLVLLGGWDVPVVHDKFGHDEPPPVETDEAEVLVHVDLALSRLDFGEESPYNYEGEQHDVDADNDIPVLFLQLDPADLLIQDLLDTGAVLSVDRRV